MNRKRRALLFGIFVGVFMASYSIGAQSPISDEDAQAFLEEFKMSVQGITALEIFAHNAFVAMGMFVPGFGVGWGTFTAWSTGLAFKSIVTANPILAKLPPLSVLLISPFGAMELVAYSIAMSRSAILVRTLVKRMSIKAEVRSTAIEVGIVVAILLAAGFIEHAMISQFGSTP
ncbi:MAG: stage II sporulation protein M [Thaumarchaeota archaeon]|nr:stage II sporulation protein M [Nitrososphaerota archaeon]